MQMWYRARRLRLTACEPAVSHSVSSNSSSVSSNSSYLMRCADGNLVAGTDFMDRPAPLGAAISICVRYWSSSG